MQANVILHQTTRGGGTTYFYSQPLNIRAGLDDGLKKHTSKNDLCAVSSCLRENLQRGSREGRAGQITCRSTLEQRHKSTQGLNQLVFYNSYKPQRPAVICSADCNLLYKYAKILHTCQLSAQISILQQ